MKIFFKNTVVNFRFSYGLVGVLILKMTLKSHMLYKKNECKQQVFSESHVI